jgi:hypothetical protein
MQVTKILAIPAMTLLMIGCSEEGCLGVFDNSFKPTLSIHPWFEESQLVMDPALAGSWTDGRDHLFTFVAQPAVKGYELQIFQMQEDVGIELDPTASLTARLFELRGVRFLDVAARNTGFLTIPGHWVARVEVEGDTLHLVPLDPAWLSERVAADKLLRFEQAACGKQKGPLVITAPTRELQGFVAGNLLSAAAFAETEKWRRPQDHLNTLEELCKGNGRSCEGR